MCPAANSGDRRGGLPLPWPVAWLQPFSVTRSVLTRSAPPVRPAVPSDELAPGPQGQSSRQWRARRTHLPPLGLAADDCFDARARQAAASVVVVVRNARATRTTLLDRLPSSPLHCAAPVDAGRVRPPLVSPIPSQSHALLFIIHVFVVDEIAVLSSTATKVPEADDPPRNWLRAVRVRTYALACLVGWVVGREPIRSGSF